MNSRKYWLMGNRLMLFFLFVVQIAICQEKMIHGKVDAFGNNVEGVNIVNLVNEKSAVTNANGEFKILAKVDDLLVFSSDRLQYKRKIIEKEDFEASLMVVKIEPKPGQLDEVLITSYRKINAVDLGIMQKHAKEYTPAERRLKTASSYDLAVGTSNSVSLDAILNSISGRTAMLKKELEVEKREFAIASLNQNYEPEYFVEKFKIPADYVQGFLYFVAEDQQVRKAINEKNRTKIEFFLAEKARQYIETLSEKK